VKREVYIYGPEGRGFEFLRAYQNHRSLLNFGGFVLLFCTFSGRLFLGLPFDPSRDPYGSSERSGLESAREEAAHRICRLFLHRGRDVGVGVQGESGAVVAQHSGEGLYVYAVLQRQDGECVPIEYNKDKSENPVIARGWRFVLILFPLKTQQK